MNIFKHSSSLLRKLNTYSIVPKLKQCSFSLFKTLALPKTRTYFLLTFRHQAFTNATFVHHLSSKSGKIFQETENEYAHKKQLNNTFSTMADHSDHLVFLYGTLKREAPNYDFIEKRTEGKAVFIGNARTVKKWPLVIASRYNIPYLLYSEGEGKTHRFRNTNLIEMRDEVTKFYYMNFGVYVSVTLQAWHEKWSNSLLNKMIFCVIQVLCINDQFKIVGRCNLTTVMTFRNIFL